MKHTYCKWYFMHCTHHLKLKKNIELIQKYTSFEPFWVTTSSITTSWYISTYLEIDIHKNPTILYYMFQPWNQSCLPLGSMMHHQNCILSHLILIHSLNTVLTRYQVCHHATSFTLVAEPYYPKPLSLLDNVPTGALSKRDR